MNKILHLNQKTMPPKKLKVLSIGTTRSLWESGENHDGGSLIRLSEYAKRVQAYNVIVHSLQKHGLTKAVEFGKNGWAIPTNARSRLTSWAKMIMYGLRLTKKQNFHLIQAQDPLFTGSAGYVVSRLTKLPLNVCVYGSDPFDPQWASESNFNRVMAPLARFVLQRAEGVQVDGSKIRRNLVRHGIEEQKIFFKPMIPDGFGHFFTVERDEKLRNSWLDNGNFRGLAIFVGRLVPQKNLFFLLDVAERCRQAELSVRFICVGDGWQRAELEQETHRRGLEDWVLWLGARPHKDVIRLMASSDIFILTSRYEGFARVLMEAAACGKPIITTDVSGADDAVISGKSGYIVPVNDLEKFEACINQLIRDPERMAAMGARGKEHIRQMTDRFDDPQRQVDIWQSVVKAYQS